jgi:hypothetical protein
MMPLDSVWEGEERHPRESEDLLAIDLIRRHGKLAAGIVFCAANSGRMDFLSMCPFYFSKSGNQWR